MGCHTNTTEPKGTLANAATRALRIAAHAAFDPLWQAKLERHPTMRRRHAREEAYAWLARALGLSRDETHIAMLSDDHLRAVIAVCEARRVSHP